MKIPQSQLKLYVGKNKSKKVYEVHHFFKDKIDQQRTQANQDKSVENGPPPFSQS